MKRLFFVLIMLILVVAASGCTSQQSTSSNKTYSANGVSFTYPGNWTEQNLTSLQSQVGSSADVLGVVGDGSGNKFGVIRLNLGSNQRVATLNEWASNYNSSMKEQGSTYISEKSLTVDGVKAYEITLLGNNSYVSGIFFVKNGTGYVLTHASPNNDQKTLEMLMKNLTVT